MPALETAADSAQERFPTLEVMRASHTRLLAEIPDEGYGDNDIGKIKLFLRKGAATGGLLDNPADRKEAQGLLDYWRANLYSASRSHGPDKVAQELASQRLADVVLAPFDRRTIRAAAAAADQWLDSAPEDETFARRLVLRLMRLRENGTFELTPATESVCEGLEPRERVAQVLTHLCSLGVVRIAGDWSGRREFTLRSPDLIDQWPRLQKWTAARKQFRQKATEWEQRRAKEKADPSRRSLMQRATKAFGVAVHTVGAWIEARWRTLLASFNIRGVTEQLLTEDEYDEAETYRDKNAAELRIVYQKRQLDKERDKRRRISAVTAIAFAVAAIAFALAAIAFDRLSVLKIRAVAAAAEAKHQNDRAVAALADAQALRKAKALTAEAEARRLAQAARFSLEQSPQRSLLLAVEALRVSDDYHFPRLPAAKETLRRTLASIGGSGFSAAGGNFHSIALDPAGRWMATGDADGTIWLWDLSARDRAGGALRREGPGGPIDYLKITPNTGWLITYSPEKPLQLWDLKGQSLPERPWVPNPDAAKADAFVDDRDGRWLIIIDKALPVLGASTVGLLASPFGQGPILSGSALCPGRTIDKAKPSGQLWDLSQTDGTMKPFNLRLEKDDTSFCDCSLSPDGLWLALVREDATVLLWNLEALKKALPGHEPGPNRLPGGNAKAKTSEFTANSKWLVVCLANGTASLFKPGSPKQSVSTVPLYPPGQESPVRTVANDLGGLWAITASQSVVENLAQPSTTRTAEKPRPLAWLWNLSVPDKMAAPTVLDGFLAATVQPSADSKVGLRFVISKDGRWLAVFDDNKALRLWNLKGHNRQLVASVVGLMSSPLGQGPFLASAIVPGRTFPITPQILGVPEKRGRGDKLSVTDTYLRESVYQAGEPQKDRDNISGFQIDPQGRWLVTGSEHGQIDFWDLNTSDQAVKRESLRGHEKWIIALEISPDGRRLATASRDGTARLWDLDSPSRTAQPVRVSGVPMHSPGVPSIVVTSDRRWLAIAGANGAVQLWDMEAADPAAHPLSLPGPAGRTTTLTLSRDERWLVTSGKGQHTWLWDLKAANPAAQPYDLGDLNGCPLRLVTSPNGNWVAVTIDQGTKREDHDWVVRVWKREGAGMPFQLVPLDSDEHFVGAITPENRWLVTYNGNMEICLRGLAAAKTTFARPIVLNPTVKVRGRMKYVMHPNGSWLVAFPLADPERPNESAGRQHDAHPLVYDLQCADPQTKDPARLHDWKWDRMVEGFSKDGRKLIVTDLNGDGLIWDLTSCGPILPTRLEVTKIPTKGSSGGAIGSSTPEPPGLPGFRSVTSPDRHWFIGGGPDGGARLWDLTADDPIRKFIDLPHADAADANPPPVSSATFSADGNWLATLRGDAVWLWDLRKGTASKAARVPGQRGKIRQVAVTGRWLALVGHDGAVRLWDFKADDPGPELLLPADLNFRRGGDLVIGPNGRWAIIADTDSFDLWDNDDDRLIELARRTVGRNLTPSEWESHFRGPYRPTFPELPVPSDKSR